MLWRISQALVAGFSKQNYYEEIDLKSTEKYKNYKTPSARGVIWKNFKFWYLSVGFYQFSHNNFVLKTLQKEFDSSSEQSPLTFILFHNGLLNLDLYNLLLLRIKTILLLKTEGIPFKKPLKFPKTTLWKVIENKSILLNNVHRFCKQFGRSENLVLWN